MVNKRIKKLTPGVSGNATRPPLPKAQRRKAKEPECTLEAPMSLSDVNQAQLTSNTNSYPFLLYPQLPSSLPPSTAPRVGLRETEALKQDCGHLGGPGEGYRWHSIGGTPL